MAPTTTTTTTTTTANSMESNTKRRVRFTKRQPAIIPDTPTSAQFPPCQHYSEQELYLQKRDVMMAVRRRQKGNLSASQYEWRGLEDHLAEGGMQAGEKRCQQYVRGVVAFYKQKENGEDKKEAFSLSRLAIYKSKGPRETASLKAQKDAKDAKEIYEKDGIDTMPYKSLASVSSHGEHGSSQKKGKRVRTDSMVKSFMKSFSLKRFSLLPQQA